MLGPVLVWFFQEAQQSRIAFFIFQLREGNSFQNVNWFDSVQHVTQKESYAWLSETFRHADRLCHYFSRTVLGQWYIFFSFKAVMACIPSYLFHLLCPFCHVPRHHTRCCCSCVLKDGCTHCISMVDIHSYKIITAVQAGKMFMIKSLNHHSYKSRLVFVHLSGTTHHLRGLW